MPSSSPANDPESPVAHIQAEYFSGPLPPPSLLARYNDVIPGGAERILAMAERQSAHREELESRVVEGNLAAQARGSWFAFILSFAAITGGLFLIHENKSAAGVTSIIGALATLAGVFVYSRNAQKKERIEKGAALQARRSH